MIYDELLVLQNSYHCHPQILATNHFVHAEASNILYGNNLFEIAIKPDGVFTHGRRCGNYSPGSNTCSFTSLVWPAYLRKAQFVRVSMSNKAWFNGFISYPLGSRIPAVANIIYSLACFLEPGHRLRHVEVQLELYPHISDDKSSVVPLVETACYPLRLLGAKPIISIQDLSLEGLEKFDVRTLPTAPLNYIDWTSKAKLVAECIAAVSQLASQSTAFPTFGRPITIALVALTTASASLQVTSGNNSGLPMWMQAMVGALLELRHSMHMFLVGVITSHGAQAPVLQQAQRLLRLEIDLRTRGW